MEVKYVQSVGVNRPAPIEPKLDKAVMLGYAQHSAQQRQMVLILESEGRSHLSQQRRRLRKPR